MLQPSDTEEGAAESQLHTGAHEERRARQGQHPELLLREGDLQALLDLGQRHVTSVDRGSIGAARGEPLDAQRSTGPSGELRRTERRHGISFGAA